MTDSLPHRRRPCAECPWRRDVEPHRFPAERFEALAATSGAASDEAQIGAPMFACHKSVEGSDDACAGWLAVEGYNHLGVRFAVAKGSLDPDVLTPGKDWPALYASYAEMAERNS